MVHYELYLGEDGKDRCSHIRTAVHVEYHQQNILQLHRIGQHFPGGGFDEELEKLKRFYLGLLQLRRRRRSERTNERRNRLLQFWNSHVADT